MINLYKEKCKILELLAALFLLNSGVLLQSRMSTPNIANLQKKQNTQGIENGLDKRSMDEIAEEREPNLYVQSQAHLKLPEVRSTLLKEYPIMVVPYFDIISQIIVKEAQLKKTHYAFYHATSNRWTLLADLFTQLYAYFNPDKNVASDFKFLRFKGESKNMSVREFLIDELKQNGLIDDSGDLKDVLLSVNLALFGNMGSKTECTWKYFLKDERPAPTEENYHAILDNFNISHDYVSELIALADLIATEEAALLQIMVPHHLVDNIIYLAWIRGVPAENKIMEWIHKFQWSKAIPKRDRGDLGHTRQSRETLSEIFKNEQENNPIFKKFMEDLESGDFSTQAYLKAYCNKPLELDKMNYTAGRALFTPDGLLNPESGIKFNRFITTSHNKLQEYNVKLNELVKKMVTNKLTKKSSTS